MVFGIEVYLKTVDSLIITIEDTAKLEDRLSGITDSNPVCCSKSEVAIKNNNTILV